MRKALEMQQYFGEYELIIIIITRGALGFNY